MLRTTLVVLLLLAVGVLAAGADYYRVLGVDKKADDRTIKKACESSRAWVVSLRGRWD